MPNDITPQIRLNAALSYLLLGPIFLLARHNPQLEHPYIRQHARYASKLMMWGILYYTCFFFLIHPLTIGVYIPIVHMPLSSIILIMSSFGVFFVFLSNAYRVFSGGENELIEEVRKAAFGQKEHRILSGEEEKIYTLLSLIPVLSAHLFSQDNSREISRAGYMLSSSFLMIFLIAFFADPVSSITFFVGAVGVFLLTYFGVCALFRGEQVWLEYIYRIPTLQDIELALISLPAYLGQYLRSSKSGKISTIESFSTVAAHVYQVSQSTHEEHIQAFPHIIRGSKIIHILSHFPGISLMSSYIAYRRSHRAFFALITSLCYGIGVIIGVYFGIHLLLAISTSLLLIHIVRSYHQIDHHSMVVESLRSLLTTHMRSTKNKTKGIASQMTRVEEKHYQ